MFGKINKRYYQDKNFVGPIALIISIMFVIIVSFFVGGYHTIQHFGKKAEVQLAVQALDKVLATKGLTYDSVKFVGRTKSNPLKFGSNYTYEYKIYGLRSRTKNYEGSTYILYSSEPDLGSPYLVYSIEERQVI